jgi:excisionase family DNA binding protein
MNASSNEKKNGNEIFPEPRVSKHPGLKSKFISLTERPAPIDPLLTVDELCDLLKVEPKTIYQLTYRGKIPHYKITNRLRFRQSEILSWIEEQRVTKTLPFEQGD